MLDHLLGRPSPTLKRIQTLLIIVLGCHLIVNGKTKQLPLFVQKLNKLSLKSPWRIALGSWLTYYIFQNLFLLVGLNAPEPLTKNTYKRSYYRATWLLTALDAGFFTAMSFKPAFLKHTFSILFSFYYLFFTEAAEEKVRKYHSVISVELMRNSWDKVSQHPVLRFLSYVMQPKMPIRDILMVDRPDYHKELPPVEIYRYYQRPKETYADNDTIILQIHGGGFVAMNPVCHEDVLCVYAEKTGLPLISINYKKAPEYPFPWPIEECFDFYVALTESRGKNIGLKGEKDLNVILICDSAGSNIACGVMFKIISHNQQLKNSIDLGLPQQQQYPHHISQLTSCPLTTPIKPPIGTIFIYPALDFEMSCWMSPSQLSLIRAESNTNLFRTGSLAKIWQTKDHLNHAKPLSIENDLEKKQSLWRKLLGMKPVHQQSIADRSQTGPKIDQHAWDAARVAMTSRMSYFNDRVITPDLMRAMAILYIGPHQSPDFETDYYISPILAPSELLAHFPKIYMMCGEKDPLVDDTIILAGRIRQAKQRYRQENPLDEDFPSGEDVRVKFLEGISHAFLQMMQFLPEGQQAARTIADWINEMAASVQHSDSESESSVKSDHIAKIITNEKDMFTRRKKQLVNNLF